MQHGGPEHRDAEHCVPEHGDAQHADAEHGHTEVYFTSLDDRDALCDSTVSDALWKEGRERVLC